MCNIADVDYHSIDFQSDNWYSKHTWFETEENDFKVWLYEYLKNNKKARQEIMRYPSTKSKNIEEAVSFFVSMFGFVTRKDDENK
jgi:hypothetical protein